VFWHMMGDPRNCSYAISLGNQWAPYHNHYAAHPIRLLVRLFPHCHKTHLLPDTIRPPVLFQDAQSDVLGIKRDEPLFVSSVQLGAQGLISLERFEQHQSIVSFVGGGIISNVVQVAD